MLVYLAWECTFWMYYCDKALRKTSAFNMFKVHALFYINFSAKPQSHLFLSVFLLFTRVFKPRLVMTIVVCVSIDWLTTSLVWSVISELSSTGLGFPSMLIFWWKGVLLCSFVLLPRGSGQWEIPVSNLSLHYKAILAEMIGWILDPVRF